MKVEKKKLPLKNEITTQGWLNLRRCETLWSARDIASIALSAEQARHTENVFHIALTRIYCSLRN